MNIAAECLDNGKFSLWNLYSSNSNRLIFWHHQCKKNYQKGHLFKHCSTLLKASNVEKKSEKNHLSSKWRERKKNKHNFQLSLFFHCMISRKPNECDFQDKKLMMMMVAADASCSISHNNNKKGWPTTTTTLEIW